MPGVTRLRVRVHADQITRPQVGSYRPDRAFARSGGEARTAIPTSIYKKNPVPYWYGVLNKCLAVTYSHTANAALPSALLRFTSEFGMGSGGSTVLLPPGKLNRTQQARARCAGILFKNVSCC